MRLLLDSYVWGGAISEVRAAGHDVNTVKEWLTDPGDDIILQRSVQENRILVTLDKDFGELVFVLDKPYRSIVRLVNIRAREQGKVILNILDKYEKELFANAILVVETDRVRIRSSENNAT